MQVEFTGVELQPKDAELPATLRSQEEAREGPLRISEDAWPRQQLDFRLLAFRELGNEKLS